MFPTKSSLALALALCATISLVQGWEIMMFEQIAGATSAHPCTGGGTTLSGNIGISCKDLTSVVMLGMNILSNPENCEFTAFSVGIPPRSMLEWGWQFVTWRSLVNDTSNPLSSPGEVTGEVTQLLSHPSLTRLWDVTVRTLVAPKVEIFQTPPNGHAGAADKDYD
ncbi:hypothetical protein C8J56DRAFT_902209 [Mycena floridula]|nr:hypothetical protein C8J56DRAFT_902209 [Mycena floridula]